MSEPASDEQRAAPPAARFPADFRVGLAILLFCAAAYAVTLGFREAPAAVAQNVQPATFPRLVIVVIMALTVAMMALSFARESRRQRQVPLMVPLTGALMVAFVVAFDLLGILAAMALFCLVMPLAWGERRWPAVVVFALLFPGAVYALFAIGLGVHFDAGLLSFN